MKYALVVLSLAAVALANPRPPTDSLSQDARIRPLGIINGSLDNLNELARKLAGEIGDATEEGIANAINFGQNVHNAIEEFARRTEEYAETIGDSLHNFIRLSVENLLGTVKALRSNLAAQIDIIDNRVLRQVLIEVERVLAAVGEQVKNLANLTQELRIDTLERFAEQQAAIRAELNEFINSQLQAVGVASGNNEIILQQAEDILNEFIGRHSSALDVCADEIEIDLQLYGERVLNLVETIQPILESLVAQVQRCLQGKNNLVANMRCVADARKILLPLTRTIKDLLDINLEGGLLTERLSKLTCGLRIITEFNLEKHNIQELLLGLTANITSDVDTALSDGSDSSSSSDDSANSSSSDDASNSSSSDDASNSSSSDDSSSSGASDEESKADTHPAA